MIVYLSSVNRVLVNFSGRTIWIADAHRDDEKRFVYMRMKN